MSPSALSNLRRASRALTERPHDVDAADAVAARRLGWICLLLIVGMALAVATLQAYSQPFWNDELFTVLTSQLSDRQTIARALKDGIDALPPPFYDVTRVARRVVSEDHVGYRLPAILGFAAVLAGIYAIVARSVDRLSALLASSVVLLTPVAAFAYEARPYGGMLACAVCAVFAWQRISGSPLYSALLAVALAAGLSLHYFAVFVWPVFVAAELLASFWRRTLRTRVWVALLAGLVPLLVYREHLTAAHVVYGENLWSPPSFRQILSGIDWLFSVNHIGLVVALLAIAAGLFRIAAVSMWLPRHMTARSPTRPLTLEAVEDGLLSLGFLAIPLIAVLSALLFHSDMTERYMLPAVIGGAMGVGYVVSATPAATRWLLLIVLVGVYSLPFPRLLQGMVAGQLSERRTASTRPFEDAIRRYAPPSLPVVVSDAHTFLELSYYSAGIRKDLVALSDPVSAVRYTGTDSVDVNLDILARYAPVAVIDYRTFARTHTNFVLVSNGGRWDWWPGRLTQDGHHLSLLGEENGVRIYSVSLK